MQPTGATDRAAETGAQVTALELFFDLVFVFTITQLTSLLAKDPTLTGFFQVVLIFGNVWWMYGGYAWLTNAVPPRELGVRLLLLIGMGGSWWSRWRFRPRSLRAGSPSASATWS